MRAKQVCILTTAESGAKICRQKNGFKPPPPPVAQAAVRSKVVVQLS